jgi:glycosyltransferase involved in cell wall biosynthesis
MNPKYSVVIPTYNSSQFIRCALDSALSQRVDSDIVEILAIDDASTDGTVGILRTYESRVSLLENAVNLGLVGNWNRCLQQSAGEYVVVLHGDDQLSPDFLAEMGAVLDRDPAIAMAVCRGTFIDELNAATGEQQSAFAKEGVVEDGAIQLLTDARILTACVLMRRSFYERYGYFDSSLEFVPDFEMWLRVATYGKLYYLDRTLAKSRRHGSNLSLKMLAGGIDIKEVAQVADSYLSLNSVGVRASRRCWRALFLEQIRCTLALGAAGHTAAFYTRLAMLPESAICPRPWKPVLGMLEFVLTHAFGPLVLCLLRIFLGTRRTVRWFAEVRPV